MRGEKREVETEKGSQEGVRKGKCADSGKGERMGELGINE